MSKLTTHVLDLVRGCPGHGIKVELYKLHSNATATNITRELIASHHTNSDGRCDQPLLEGNALTTGCYEIVFHAGAYFDLLDEVPAEPKFLDEVVVRFGVSDPTQHYHVPLLLSRYGYSTYRGS